MTPVIYDGSFDGLLTVVFEIYEYKIAEPQITAIAEASGSLFGNVHAVQTNAEKAMRVYKKLQQKISAKALSRFYKTYLSEHREMENHIYRYIAYILSETSNAENNFSHPDVLFVQQTSRKVHREKHRMEAFVRFQLTKDNLYYCIIQPDFNVLPLISNHFEKRYADQRWLIYDSRRKYGIFFDGEKTAEVSISFSADINDKSSLKALFDEKEELYQQLWRTYFSNVNIAARKNMRLHIQHMPKRYWRYLPEKRGSINGKY